MIISLNIINKIIFKYRHFHTNRAISFCNSCGVFMLSFSVQLNIYKIKPCCSPYIIISIRNNFFILGTNSLPHPNLQSPILFCLISWLKRANCLSHLFITQMLYLLAFIFDINFSARVSLSFTVFAASPRRSLLFRNFDTKKPVNGIGEIIFMALPTALGP